MKIIEKIAKKAADNFNNPGVTIAFFGDSVMQGCFDVFIKDDGKVETFYDKNSAYHNYIAKIFSVLYPTVPVNIINAGISGDNAPHALKRMDDEVLKYKPDLTVVCFGLNDCGGGEEGLEKYKSALDGIFEKLKASGSEIIFMTPNMMCTKVSCHIKDERVRAIAEDAAKRQSDGILDLYIENARMVAKENEVVVCDCYEKWKTLDRSGADVTELLANRINHPTEEMNWLFAVSLVETMFK